MRKFLKWTFRLFLGFSALVILVAIFAPSPAPILDENGNPIVGAALIEHLEATNQTAAADAERRRQERAAASEAEAVARAATEQREEAENKSKGFHCLSPWDGSHSAFKQEVKDAMREPNSFEHIATRVTPIAADGTHNVFMEYRARNGFGGMNIGTAVGSFNNSNCAFNIIALE